RSLLLSRSASGLSPLCRTRPRRGMATRMATNRERRVGKRLPALAPGHEAPGPSPANRDETAPDGDIRPRSECERAGFEGLFYRGKGTVRRLADRLARRGRPFSVAEVQVAVDGWIERGWVDVTDGQAHLSGAAIHYLR